MFVLKNAKTGINTATPTEMLEVNGNIKNIKNKTYRKY